MGQKIWSKVFINYSIVTRQLPFKVVYVAYTRVRTFSVYYELSFQEVIAQSVLVAPGQRFKMGSGMWITALNLASSTLFT